ncbi:hypothetical protein PtrM4_020810 [Pyrenophora tritici-repentis]|uniref:Uncharacterized protein n=1 Tax=Pyrenophora tritici-repentis TaxID=45151 RepID=A0A834S8M0_9PLEO|nr:hypothetical protein PtrM4_020810 [Pyrenophora tritici-repentis]
MAASVVLTHLPRDASKALENAGGVGCSESNNPPPTYRLRPAPNSAHLQAQHNANVCNHCTFSAQTTGCQGA